MALRPWKRNGSLLPSRDPLALVPVIVATLLYLPILRVWFFADDFQVLASLRDGNLPYFILCPFGGHNFVVRNAIYALSYWTFGPRPAPFFATMLVTHAVNVWLLFRVLRNIGASRALACLVATLWGTLPVHASTLGWYTMYGQVLTDTVLLLVLDRLTRLAATRTRPDARTMATWWILLLMGTMCSGFGIGIALVFPAVLFLLLPDVWARRGPRLAFLALPAAALATYFACRHLANFLAPLPFDEAWLLAVVRGGDLAPVAAMLTHLVAFSMASTLLGPFGPPGYPSVGAALAAGLFALCAALAFWCAAPTARRELLAFSILAGGIYAVIAIGRANAAKVFFLMSPARAATTPRYQYVGAVAIVTILCLVIRELGRGIEGLGRPARVVGGVLAWGLLAAGLYRSGVPIADHRACADYVTETLASITRERAAVPAGSTAYLENGSPPGFVLGGGLRPMVFPGRAAVYLVFAPPEGARDPSIRFVERDPEIVGSYRALPWSRLGRLLVTPEELPGK